MEFYLITNQERREENFLLKTSPSCWKNSRRITGTLGIRNLDSLRDWGYAKDYVECMWLILQHGYARRFL